MVSNQEILETIKTKLEDKNEVIREQQEMIIDLQGQVESLQGKLTSLELLETERKDLIEQLRSLD